MSIQEKIYTEKKISKEEGREEGIQEGIQKMIDKLRKKGMSEEEIKLILAD